jgi:hypothetical protein
MEPARIRLATEGASLPTSHECPGHVAQKVTGAFLGRGRHIAWQEWALPMNRADGPHVRPRSSRQRGRTMPVQVLARSLPGLRARAASVAQRLLTTRWRVQPHRPDSTENTLIYRAAAALPHTNREWAAHALACQLRIMATVAGGTLDWTTLAMTGPTNVAGALRVDSERRRPWSERRRHAAGPGRLSTRPRRRGRHPALPRRQLLRPDSELIARAART